MKPFPVERFEVGFVVPYIGTWIETEQASHSFNRRCVVPYIGTWIETKSYLYKLTSGKVVPYIGTWIETDRVYPGDGICPSYLI